MTVKFLERGRLGEAWVPSLLPGLRTHPGASAPAGPTAPSGPGLGRAFSLPGIPLSGQVTSLTVPPPQAAPGFLCPGVGPAALRGPQSPQPAAASLTLAWCGRQGWGCSRLTTTSPGLGLTHHCLEPQAGFLRCVGLLQPACAVQVPAAPEPHPTGSFGTQREIADGAACRVLPRPAGAPGAGRGPGASTCILPAPPTPSPWTQGGG